MYKPGKIDLNFIGLFDSHKILTSRLAGYLSRKMLHVFLDFWRVGEITGATNSRRPDGHASQSMMCGPWSVARGSWPAGTRRSVMQGAILPTFILHWEAATMLFAVAGAGAFM